MEEQQPYVKVPEDVSQAVVLQSATFAWTADDATGTARSVLRASRGLWHVLVSCLTSHWPSRLCQS